ncbi:MAG TPA: MarR family transcriptional regulator [Rubrivivax sp.]|nr:MarR family transcriptional regulator [Rubrivivax sp.]HPO19958.1 MarR family transcriptional regulator [Rubrivivax sp.]
MQRAAKPQAAPLLGDQAIGLEARSHRDDHLSLRLWLRLLACRSDIEKQIRARLRKHAGMTLARFDYLAQLHRHPDGLRMSALSRYLMVTGGNVTGLTDQLERDGLVQRDAEPGDRRSWRVVLTAKGREAFEAIVGEHERWVVELFAGLSETERRQLYDLLGQLRVQLSTRHPATTENPAS